MKKYIISLFIILVVISTSCEKFIDVNDAFDYPAESTPNFLLPPVLANLSTSHFDHGECNAYFTQQLATLSGYHKYKDRWDYVDANRIAQWRRHYHDIGVNALNLISTAKGEESKNYEAVGRICFVLSFQLATDIFGDMPYTEAFAGNPSPKYDTQDFIYEKMLEELDLAIENIDEYDEVTSRKMTSEQDIVFNGDVLKWKQLAYAVKARILLHLTPNVNQNYADVINAADIALSDWNDATYDYSVTGTEDVPDLQLNQWGPSVADPGWDYANNILKQSAPSEFILLNVLQFDNINQLITDPRQPLLLDTVGSSAGTYLYVVPSEGKDATRDDDEYPSLLGNYITQDKAPMLWLTEEELHFIKAEAYFQSGDAASAFTSFTDGIRRHMQRVGVDPADITTFLGGTTVPQSAVELTLSDIMMQKYMALYLHGETWTDMRRHDYDPEVYKGLKKPKYLAYYWNEDNASEWIERLPYDTETEEIYNKPTLEALGAYQNPEWLKKPMFWAK